MPGERRHGHQANGDLGLLGGLLLATEPVVIRVESVWVGPGDVVHDPWFRVAGTVPAAAVAVVIGGGG